MFACICYQFMTNKGFQNESIYTSCLYLRPVSIELSKSLMAVPYGLSVRRSSAAAAAFYGTPIGRASTVTAPWTA